MALSILPGAAFAQEQPQLSADQKGYIAYHYCMMNAAMRASRTNAAAEDIFGLAKAECVSLRSSVIVGQEGNQQFLSALDDADQEKAANFPEWINGVRQQRLDFERRATEPPSQ